MSRRISLQDIADSLDISRGTVDRAIHGRGRISSETRERVIAEARRLGYIDRKVNSFLPLQDNCRIYAIIPGDDPFFDRIENGINKAVHEIFPRPDFELQHIPHDKPELQIEYLEHITAQGTESAGVLIVPSQEPKLGAAIAEAEAAGLRIAALNTDAPGSGRSFFIGQDLYASGRTAGELMMRMNPGQVVILSGFSNIWAHSERVRGFQDVYRESGRLNDLAGPYYTRDDTAETGVILEKLPGNFSGVFTVSGLTTEGAGRYFSGCSKKICLIGFDCTGPNTSFLKSGAISCLISQSPQLQGYLAVRRMMQILKEGGDGSPDEVKIPIDIYVKENIDFFIEYLNI